MSNDLQDNHNEIMAKLSFVNDLAECVMELAMAKGAPLNTLSESVNWKQVKSSDCLCQNFSKVDIQVIHSCTHILHYSVFRVRVRCKESQCQSLLNHKGIIYRTNSSWDLNNWFTKVLYKEQNGAEICIIKAEIL